MTTQFELLFGLKPWTLSFPSQDVQHLHFGESFAAERLQILKQARLIAQQHTADWGEDYKFEFDKKAQLQSFQILPDIGCLLLSMIQVREITGLIYEPIIGGMEEVAIVINYCIMRVYFEVRKTTGYLTTSSKLGTIS